MAVVDSLQSGNLRFANSVPAAQRAFLFSRQSFADAAAIRASAATIPNSVRSGSAGKGLLLAASKRETGMGVYG
jgi:hypothetical protein